MRPLDPDTALPPSGLPDDGDIDIDIDIPPLVDASPESLASPAPPHLANWRLMTGLHVADATPPQTLPTRSPASARETIEPVARATVEPEPDTIVAPAPEPDTIIALTPIRPRAPSSPVAAAPSPDTITTTDDAASTIPAAAATSGSDMLEEPASGHRSGAERTGRTGIFFTPQHLADADLDDLPPFDPPSPHESGWQYVTGRPVNRMRRFLVTRLSPVIGLSAVIVWSYMQLGDTRTRARPEAPLTVAPVDGTVPAPALPAEPPEFVEDDEPEPAPRDLRLASADVTEVLDDGSVAPRRMNKILARDRVTILNLWATYCAPCKDELPAFRQLFEQQKVAWRGDVEFIPVQIDDPIDGAAARREHAGQMPPFRHFVSDRGLPTGIKAALLATTPAPTPWSLPVTVVVRCDGEIEKVFARSFTTLEDLRPVFDAVGRARQKLPDCRARAAKAAALETVRAAPVVSFVPAPRCGEIVCQPDERCEPRHPPTFKPACVTARGTVDWEAP